MDLVSCDRCGVVVDREKIIFPDTHDHDSGEIVVGAGAWVEDEYVAVVDCPISTCSGTIANK